MNPETYADGYKVDHRQQYPGGTTLVFSNLTARKTRREGVDRVVTFGLQYFIKKYLIQEWNEKFFSQPKGKVLARFVRRINNYLGPNEVGDSHIAELHDLGYLPLEIFALPEGTEYGIRIPSIVFWNTLPNFFWLTNYIETVFSTTIWGPCTSATTAHQYKKLLTKYAIETVGNADFVQWQGHDFSYRGMFGMEAALMSGAAHLISFTGTDTIPAIDWLEEYYNADSDNELVGGSVPATEHSVACSTILNFVKRIRVEKTESGENIVEDELMNLADVEYIRHLIQDIYPTGIVSIVSDSFDYWNTITKTAAVLKDAIMARNGKVVFRPDTGDPVRVVCGYNYAKLDGGLHTKISRDLESEGYEAVLLENGNIYSVGTAPQRLNLTEHELKGSIECLWGIFGGTITEKGYKVLDSHVGLIYGDSITLQRCHAICEGLKQKGFASTNIVFGIGSYTYQYVTRDTDGYAVKATYCEVDGEKINIYKDPKTDDGTKKSACGLLAVFKNPSGEFYLEEKTTWDRVRNCEFVPVFKDGKLLKDWALKEVRDNLTKYL